MPAGNAAPIHVLVTVDFPESVLDRIRSVDPRIVVHHHPVSPDEPGEGAVPDDVLRLAEVAYTSAVLPGPDVAPSLRWAQLDTSGVDHLAGSGLWASDCVVTTLGGVSPAPLAEWVIMMVLAHAHHLRHTERLQREGVWPSREYRWTQLMPRDLRTSTMAIVGYGRIGAEVARLGRALGMTILAVRSGSTTAAATAAAIQAPEPRFRVREPVPDVEAVALEVLDQALGRADYVVLTVPLTARTAGMIGAAQFAAMKPGAVLINGSRGGVVDEGALLDALDADRLDLCASDVFTDEPLPQGHPLWTHPRCLITPHVAGFAPDYLDAVSRLFTENLRRYLAGEPLLNVADRERGY